MEPPNTFPIIVLLVVSEYSMPGLAALVCDISILLRYCAEQSPTIVYLDNCVSLSTGDKPLPSSIPESLTDTPVTLAFIYPTTFHVVYAFLLLSYGDSTQEEITVPMVNVDGDWKMK